MKKARRENRQRRANWATHRGLRGYRPMDIEKRITAAFHEFSERSTQPRQVIARSLIRLGKSGAAFSAEDLIQQASPVQPADRARHRLSIHREACAA